jgi:hypothetical protein
MVNVGNFPVKGTASSKGRNLLGACLTHILHDGYTDQLYALLPAWQTPGFAGLCIGLVLAGIGSSVQHPRAFGSGDP